MNDFGFEKFLIFTKLEVTKKRRTWKEKGPDKVYADLSRKITFLVPLAREPSHGIVTHSSSPRAREMNCWHKRFTMTMTIRR